MRAVGERLQYQAPRGEQARPQFYMTYYEVEAPPGTPPYNFKCARGRAINGHRSGNCWYCNRWYPNSTYACTRHWDFCQARLQNMGLITQPVQRTSQPILPTIAEVRESSTPWWYPEESGPSVAAIGESSQARRRQEVLRGSREDQVDRENVTEGEEESGDSPVRVTSIRAPSRPPEPGTVDNDKGKRRASKSLSRSPQPEETTSSRKLRSGKRY